MRAAPRADFIPTPMFLPFLAAFQLAATTPPVIIEVLADLQRPRRDKRRRDAAHRHADRGRRTARRAGVAARRAAHRLLPLLAGRRAARARFDRGARLVLVATRSTSASAPSSRTAPSRATLADRDRISADDNVEIHLDTFDERNRAFVFIVNPLGVQADGTKSEGGGFIPGSNVGPGRTI